MNAWPYALGGLAFVVFAWWAIERTFHQVVVLEHERGLEYRRGRLTRELGPGSYWGRRGTWKVVAKDLRPTLINVLGQELLATDGLTIKVSLVARRKIVDARAMVSASDNADLDLYLELQLALRDVFAGATSEEALAKRSQWGPLIKERVAPKALALGIELMTVEVKDLMFPADVKRLMAAVTLAKAEGLAALERARAETATLRHLANAAALVDKSPGLAHLRTLMVVQESKGNSIILGAPATLVPRPSDQGGS